MPKIVHCGLDYSGGGGGSGEANFIELSQSAYDELTYEEKHDPNKMYMITDGPQVDAQYFDPVIYSLEEREIGVWTDGKPLYQKTYVVTNVTSQGTRLDTISDIDRLVDFSGTFNRVLNGNKTLYEIDGRTESANYNNYGCIWNVNNGGEVNVTFYGYSVSEIESLSATIQYTKTTDVPGSGSYTTLGVPAVHYDDTERVIGTWFGETLYQKTYYKNNTTGSFQDYIDMATIDSSMDVKNQFGYYKRVIPGELDMFMPIDSVYTQQNSVYLLAIRVTNNKIQYFINGYGSQITDIYVTLQYTKTTD